MGRRQPVAASGRVAGARRCLSAPLRARGGLRWPQGWTQCASAQGFTLLELLIVLVLMAIITASVFPMFGGPVSTSVLRGSARSLAAGLRLARSEALSQRRETFLTLDVANRSFRVDRDPHVHALPKKAELKLFTAQNDLVDGSVGSIRFYPDGGSNGGRITIGAGQRRFDVDVDWLTGRVAILE